MTLGITIDWIVFSLIFAGLGTYYRRQASNRMPAFPMPQRGGLRPVGQVEFLGEPLDKPLVDFVAQVNQFIEENNRSASRINRTNAAGYYIAAATALFSALLEDRSLIAGLLSAK